MTTKTNPDPEGTQLYSFLFGCILGFSVAVYVYEDLEDWYYSWFETVEEEYSDEE
jgi:hypothetical protein